MLSQAKSLTLTLAFALSLVPKLAAQPPLEPGQLGHITVGPGMGMQTKAGMTIGLHMENLDAAPVKGSPFCATVTSEHTQMFADGNRIHTTEDSSLCRDKEGRTRREAQLNLLGAVQQNTAQKLITIVDPVAGFRYTLDTGAKMARKMSLSAGLLSAVLTPCLLQLVIVYMATMASAGLGRFSERRRPGPADPARADPLSLANLVLSVVDRLESEQGRNYGIGASNL